MEQIARLKEELLVAKTEQSIRINYEKADHESKEEKEQRDGTSIEKVLEDKIADLERRMALERKVHTKIENFLNEKKEKINEDAGMWHKRTEEDFAKEDGKLSNLNDKRQKVKARLNELEESVMREELRQREREEEEQYRAEMDRLKAKENERKAAALKIIVAEYMEFREKMASMKKKKGRRGKKGGKGKKKK